MATGGGYGIWPAFRVVEEGGAYVIKDAAGTAAATTYDDAVFLFTDMEEVKFSPQKGGAAKVTMTQYQDDKDWDAFLDEFATVPDGGTSLPEKTMLDGSKIGGSTSSGKMFLLLAGGPIDKKYPTERKARWAIFTITEESGEETFKDGDYIKPSCLLESVKPKYPLTIPKELYPTGAFTVAANQTLPSGSKHFVRKNLPKQT